MKTNDIKKGMRVRLRNGWCGTMKDNMKGQTRLVEVEGHYTEIGSVYAHDIAYVLVNGRWHGVDYTPKQVKLMEFMDEMEDYTG